MPLGRLFFAERPRAAGRGRVMDGWTVALYELPEARQLAYGLVCLWRPGRGVGRQGPAQQPAAAGADRAARGRSACLTSATGSRSAAKRIAPAVDALFSPEFVSWMIELPWEKTGGTVTRFELRNGTLCVYVREKLRTAETLDAFAGRAAHIAARVLTAAARTA